MTKPLRIVYTADNVSVLRAIEQMQAAHARLNATVMRSGKTLNSYGQSAERSAARTKSSVSAASSAVSSFSGRTSRAARDASRAVSGFEAASVRSFRGAAAAMGGFAARAGHSVRDVGAHFGAVGRGASAMAARARGGLAAAASAVAGFAGRVRSGMSGAVAAMSRVGSRASSALSAIGGGAARTGKAMFGMARQVSAAAAIATSAVVGFGNRAASGLAHAAEAMAATSRRFGSAGHSMMKIGKDATTHVTLPILAAGAAAFKASMDFQDAMNRIVRLVGVSRKQVSEWSQEILRLGPEVGKSPKELADALYFITSAGFRGSRAMDVLTASAKASAAGLGETKTVADAVTSAVNAFGQRNLSASRATDVLVGAVTAGKMPADELAGSLGKVIGVAAAAGARFDEVGAAIASMTRVGLNSFVATTALRGIFLSLIKPTTAQQQAMHKMGLSSQEVTDTIRKKGLLAALKLLTDHAHGNLAAMSALIPDHRALTGLLAMMGKNAGSTAGVFNQLSHSAGSTDKAFSEFKKGPKSAVDDLKASAMSLAISVGNALSPAIQMVAHWLSGAAASMNNWISGLSSGQRKILGVALLLAASFGPALVGIGVVARVVSIGLQGLAISIQVVRLAILGITRILPLLNAELLASPWFWVVAAVAILAAGLYLLYTRSKTFRDIVKAVGGFLGNVFTRGLHYAGVAVDWLGRVISKVAGFVRKHFAAIKIAMLLLAAAAMPVVVAIAFVATMIIRHWHQIWSGIMVAVRGIKTAFMWLTAPSRFVFGLIFKLFMGLVGVIQRNIPRIGSLFHRFGSWLGSLGRAWSLVSSIVHRVVSGIISTVSRMYHSVASTLTRWGANVRHAVSSAWSAAYGAVRRVVTLIYNTITRWAHNVSSFISRHLSSLRSVFSRVWSTIWSVVSRVANSIASTLLRWAHNVGALIGRFLHTLGQLFSRGWALIRNVVARVVQAIAGLLSRWAHNVLSLLSRWGRSVSDFFRRLWDTVTGVVRRAAGALTNTIHNLLSRIGAMWSSTWNKIKSIAKSIWDSIVAAARGFANALGAAFGKVKDAIKGPVAWVDRNVINKFLGGVQTLAGKIGLKLSLPRLPERFATGGPVPGVGNSDSVPALLTPGEYVVPRHVVERLGLGFFEALRLGMGIVPPSQSPIGMKAGGLVGGLAGLAKRGMDMVMGVISGSVDKVLGALHLKWSAPGSGVFQDILHKFFDKITHGVVDWLKSKVSPAGGGGGFLAIPGGGGPAQLNSWILTAAALEGVPGWIGGLRTIAMRESGGNPNAVNRWDSNAAAGHPSMGLMQTIGPTFAAFRDPRLPNNILDPVANIAAAIRYIKSRYGSIANVQQANPNAPPKGYRDGLWSAWGDAWRYTHDGEMILDARTASVIRDAVVSGGRGAAAPTEITVYVQGSVITERELIDRVHSGLRRKGVQNSKLNFR